MAIAFGYRQFRVTGALRPPVQGGLENARIDLE